MLLLKTTGVNYKLANRDFFILVAMAMPTVVLILNICPVRHGFISQIQKDTYCSIIIMMI